LVVAPEKPIPQATQGFARCFRKPIGQSALLDSIVECFCAQDVSPPTLEAHGLHWSEGNTEPETRPLRILLAEDNVTNQLFAQEVLLRQGWHCDIVSNGREAIQAIDRASYDLVLMDCQMPEMDGFEATRRIRRQEQSGERSTHVPIVALTANAIKGDRERCLDAGMDEYLSKPYKPRELTELVDRLCGSVAKPTSFVANQKVGVAITEESPIDVKLFVEERCMGDIAFAQSLLESFNTNSAKRLEEIIAHWQARDAMAAGEAAHGLKGIAGIVTANRLSDLADRIESAGKSNDLKSIEAMIDDLKREVVSCRSFANSIQLQPQG
jgi:Amt family ammonium transporter